MQPSIFCKSLEFYGYNLVLGIHDSAFASLLAAIRPSSTLRHVACSNNAEACAMAAGYYLGTGKAAMIYMEETSIGDAISSLTTLLQNYERPIPALLLIATPPSSMTSEEPSTPPSQKLWSHLQQFLQFPSKYISSDVADFQQTLTQAEAHFKKNGTPFVILVPENIFEVSSATKATSEETEMRESLPEKGSLPSDTGNKPYVGKFYGSQGRSMPSRSKFKKGFF